ncbi:TauD/TfdA dioxygenase family protein [Streptomyces sp. NPDC127084]|uniref:TauD/TfdA dioxygenase family protein n=1 Tax=Streptomyces sp. NPDC127084 TaxID=3347133 RepID=UPI00365397E8
MEDGSFIRITPLAGCIGAEVGGVDLAVPLSPRLVAAVRRALEDHRVLIFRDQHLTHDQQIAYAGQFGPPAPSHPWVPHVAGHPYVHALITGHGENPEMTEEQRHAALWRNPDFLSGWHSDITAAVDPPAFCVLRAEKVPSHGGDTIWADMVTAYERLSAPLRRFTDDLTAEHRYLVGYVPFGVSDAFTRTSVEAALVAHHPVVRALPDSGKRCLFVSPGFTSHINELTPAESRRILDLLFTHTTHSDLTFRHRWTAGDVAMWDNRATIHVAPTDHEKLGQERAMYRVFVAGEPAVGPSGATSRAISGDPYQVAGVPAW